MEICVTIFHPNFPSSSIQTHSLHTFFNQVRSFFRSLDFPQVELVQQSFHRDNISEGVVSLPPRWGICLLSSRCQHFLSFSENGSWFSCLWTPVDPIRLPCSLKASRNLRANFVLMRRPIINSQIALNRRLWNLGRFLIHPSLALKRTGAGTGGKVRRMRRVAFWTARTRGWAGLCPVEMPPHHPGATRGLDSCPLPLQSYAAAVQAMA